jgi:hypothetical protein
MKEVASLSYWLAIRNPILTSVLVTIGGVQADASKQVFCTFAAVSVHIGLVTTTLFQISEVRGRYPRFCVDQGSLRFAWVPKYRTHADGRNEGDRGISRPLNKM